MCRVAARLESIHNTAAEKWHVAYHGVSPSDVRKLLDSGDLLTLHSKYTNPPSPILSLM